MAGGKETPRQKMIGMMYLVLTALLALNVSKSILDAFVAIEENTQKANIVLHDRGSGFYKDVNEELSAQKGMAAKGDSTVGAKIEKLNYVIKQMDEIDKITAVIIQDIDKLKIEIMEKSGEAVKEVKKDEEATILWSNVDKSQPCLPRRMNLMAVQAKDQYDVPMHEIIGEDIKNPTGKGVKLWKDFNKYRADLMKLCANYEWGTQKFELAVKDINKFANNKDLQKQVAQMVDGSKANLKEDRQVLIDLYMGLTKPERMKVHDIEGVHWIGATFDHSPLVAALAGLSSMQQDILAARALAMAHWKSKVSTGEYSFNKIMPLAYGPSVVNSGEEFELQVMMAAFDSDNQPTVTVDGGNGTVSYPGNGQGVVKMKAGSGTMTLTGTVSIKNKAGVPKTEKWTRDVVVMAPSGSIELPEMNVLYRGYQNKVAATASGYPESKLTCVSNASASAATLDGGIKGYIVSPGGGSTAVLAVTGMDSKAGTSAQLRKMEFRVQEMPKPSLFWGKGNASGGNVTNSPVLLAEYDEGIPLRATFTILNWELPAKGGIIKGNGNNISAAKSFISTLQRGEGVSFICQVKMPSGKVKTISGTWKK